VLVPDGTRTTGNTTSLTRTAAMICGRISGSGAQWCSLLCYRLCCATSSTFFQARWLVGPSGYTASGLTRR
jgi:hypothetical protein